MRTLPSTPHGLLALKTFTNLLTAGSHTLTFELADVNDHILDSGVFISNLRTGVGGTITGTYDDDIKDDGSNAPVPEPGTMVLLGIGLGGLAIFGKRRMNKEA